MRRREYIVPTEKQKREVAEVLKEGPVTHDEIAERVDMSEEEMRRARNELWVEGKVRHTLDRRFDWKEPDS